MRVGRIPPDETKGFCHGCHNRAVIEVVFGAPRPNLRLCGKCSKYLSDFLARRVAEHNAGTPIPTPKANSDDWGNR
jgi:hypothetical protein